MGLGGMQPAKFTRGGARVGGCRELGLHEDSPVYTTEGDGASILWVGVECRQLSLHVLGGDLGTERERELHELTGESGVTEEEFS